MSHSISQTSHLVSVAKLMTHNDGRASGLGGDAMPAEDCVRQPRIQSLSKRITSYIERMGTSQGLLVVLPGRSCRMGAFAATVDHLTTPPQLIERPVTMRHDIPILGQATLSINHVYELTGVYSEMASFGLDAISSTSVPYLIIVHIECN